MMKTRCGTTRRLKETSMEFNAFQMMNQTHEHECHLLTQQLKSKNTRTTKEQGNGAET